MSTDDRLDRLEQRVAELEGLVRKLTPLTMALPSASPRRTPPISQLPDPRRPAPPPDARPIPAASATAAPRPSFAREETPARDTEQWLGQRGLLGIGVLFVILAAGYLLKYSFDQGWVSPLVRCIGGTIGGVVIGSIGWRLHDKGLRTYGAALIGCGAAVLYLAVWAAVSLYRLLPPPEGIAGLALDSLGLAAIAYAIDIQALGATAVLGAFLAPILLGQQPSNANVLLVYLSCMAFALGWVAARKRWRLAAALIALSYFGLGGASGAAEHATPWLVLLFGVAGGSLGLHVGLRERWWETRFLSFAGGWGLVAVASDQIGRPWLVVLAAVGLAMPVWAQAMRAPAFWPVRTGNRVFDAGPSSLGEILYFLTTPVLLGWAVHQLDPQLFGRDPGLAPLIVGVAYLARGYIGIHPEFVLVGTTAAGYAALLQWSGLGAVWALFALSLVWAALDHLLRRTDGRWFALLALAGGLVHLLDFDAATRPAASAAFIDRWALALWGGIGCLVALARGLWRAGDNDSTTGSIRGICWVLAAILLFGGVTNELPRFFGAAGFQPETAVLMKSESVILWWLFFFGAALVLGVTRGLKSLRALAGMGLLAAALFLAYVDLVARGAGDAAFWGLWSGVLWVTIGTLAGLAVWLPRRAPELADEPLLPGLWIVAGVLLLLGVTGELDRFFLYRNLEGNTAALWTGLSISVWWILFASGLVLLGFRRDLRVVRQAGLLVAAMAALKILVHDLSTLNALYRVGSVFITGLVSLLLAYLYNRKAKEA